MNSSNTKKILVLAGKPIGSEDIVRYAKSKGYYTIVCDYLAVENSPAKQLADESWNYSTADVDLIVKKAKEEGIDAVFTGVHEFNIARCQEICEKLKLPFYVDKQTMLNAANKSYYKNIFAKFDIPLIPQYKIEDKKTFPILLKPVDGSGAYGLKICNSEEEFQENLPKALKFSAKGEVLIEQYIKEKEEITTVYIIKDGVPHLASVADRIVKYFDNAVIPLPIAYIWHSKYLDLYEKTIDENMKKAIQFMGLQNGMLFIQSIVKDNIIMPYDIGFRLSGTQEQNILEAMCNYNPLKLMVDYALTGKFGDSELIKKINPHFNGLAAQITFLAEPATVGRFQGLEDVEKLNGVIRIIKNKLEGETIPQSALGTLNQVVLRVFIKADNQENLISLIKLIRDKVKILSIDGKDIGF